LTNVREILRHAETYFKRRFAGDGESPAEVRFSTALNVAKLAQLFRFKGDITDASVEAIVAGQSKRIFATPAAKVEFIKEWKVAKTQAATYTETSTRERAGKIADYGIGCFSWWRTRLDQFKVCNRVLSLLVVLQPSSAASERVFSLYNNVNKGDPCTRLMDLKRAGVMVPYNERMRARAVVRVEI
jgi:hypothetical protein